MPAETIRLCAVAGCGTRPTVNWLLSEPATTHEMDLCDEHAAPLRDLAALGRRVEVLSEDGESEAVLMDRLWWKDK